jgi:chromate transporter
MSDKDEPPAVSSPATASPPPAASPRGPAEPALTPAADARPSLLELFVAFATMSLYGFGGVLAWAYRVLVEQKRWMTPEQFNDCYALCNFLPGPNIINLSVVFGRSIRGVPGAFVAIVGLVGPSVLIVLFFGLLYARYGQIDALQRMFTGVAAAAAGLCISLSLKMADPIWKQRKPLPLAVAFVTLVAVGIMRWPIWWVLGVLIPLSIAVALRRG